MKNSRRLLPEINTGSMADIAFLLLLFFLVATTISTDKGIDRQLSKPCPPDVDCTKPIKPNNLLNILVNGNKQILVNDEIIDFKDLKAITMNFLDNNGSSSCDYCTGEKLSKFSDSPKQAVVSIKNTNDTTYAFYIAVQDELTKAYYELRRNYAINILGKNENELSEKDMDKLKKAYPFRLSEAEPENSL